ncbi:hypothetical protein [uncultured Roseobacter sp.]|uniref:hypothetical protein n=1 Tax=uncultured Roseobacter sp. TaxID=114847 RepID=UPI00262FF9E4|nr:hypothetical protein [uncultured Roseobacter sp.]
MEENLEVSESFVLRRFLGGVLFLVALPTLFFAFLAVVTNAHLWAVLLLGCGLLLVSVGYSAFRFGRSPRVRLRVTDRGLWLLPDGSDWYLFKEPKLTPMTLFWGEIEGVGDGGVFYGYRKLRFSTEDSDHHLNTTFLDSDSRSVVSAIDQKLRQNGKQLVEQKIGMVARSGKWRVAADELTL